MRQWRLIYDSPAAGARNMALDEAILEAVGVGRHAPTLRLYAWSPPCLSLGYGQRSSDVDFEGCRERGWDVVRRPTGGRAILHTDELTYSLALPADHPLAAGTIVESYWRISGALVQGLSHLGVSTQAEARQEHPESTVVCFETPSHYEITANRRKLVGSAQVRRHNGVLQHGTLPLYGDLARICDGLSFANEMERDDAKRRVRAQAITLEEALDGEVEFDRVADAIVNGFQAAFDVDFGDTFAVLSHQELDRAQELEAQKYGNPDWTQRR